MVLVCVAKRIVQLQTSDFGERCCIVSIFPLTTCLSICCINLRYYLASQKSSPCMFDVYFLCNLVIPVVLRQLHFLLMFFSALLHPCAIGFVCAYMVAALFMKLLTAINSSVDHHFSLRIQILTLFDLPVECFVYLNHWWHGHQYPRLLLCNVLCPLLRVFFNKMENVFKFLKVWPSNRSAAWWK